MHPGINVKRSASNYIVDIACPSSPIVWSSKLSPQSIISVNVDFINKIKKYFYNSFEFAVRVDVQCSLLSL